MATVADLKAAGITPAAIHRLKALRCRLHLESLGFTRSEAEGLTFVAWLVNTRGSVAP